MKRTIAALVFVLWSVHALAKPPAEVATPPTKPGVYENGDWKYEYSVGFQGKAAICRGRLHHKGNLVTAPAGTLTNTPVGRFIFFPYDQGWLNTRFNEAVFKTDGTLRDDLREFFDILRKQEQAQNNTSEDIRRPADGSPKSSR